MELFNIYTTKAMIVIEVNIVIVALIMLLLYFICKVKCIGIKKSQIVLEEINLGKESCLKFKIDKRDKEVAYKIWVELNTRKTGLIFDPENDVITEVYDSWYHSFSIIRELIKEIPYNKFKEKNNLVEITCELLNIGMRPHLTNWQAKFRKWYENEIKDDSNKNKSPQEIQKQYPEYNELVEDLQKANKMIMEYKNLLYKVIKK